MADLTAAREALATATADRAETQAHRMEIGAALAAERRRASALASAGDTDGVAATQAEIGRLAADHRSDTALLVEADALVTQRIGDLLGEEIELEADVPLVLLPVRLECRSTRDQTALHVRIYPDTVHVEALDEGLDVTERAAGEAYWTAAWEAGDTQAPFSALVAAVGAPRAPWVAEALRPINPGERGTAPPEFPKTPPRAYSPAIARTLPDRFVARLEQDGAEPVVRAGRPVRDELAVGLAGRDDLVPVTLGDQDLPPMDESLRWLVDYDTAVDVGMAVTVPLAVPGHAVRRLMVYGVRAALAPADGAARLERLLQSHRFTDGAEFLAQGTPTNNTDSARTSWTPRTPPGPPALDPVVPVVGSNAAVAAGVLGVQPAALVVLPKALDVEQERAAAFNTLLWDTTWGEAIEHLTPGGRANGLARLDSPTLDAVREHWIGHIRGRGPVPALRLGRQPYGVLPVVATDRASWKPLRGDVIEDRLVPFLDRSLRSLWTDAAERVPTVMDGDLDTVLPRILGTDAVLRGLRVRTALEGDNMFETAMALTVPDLDHRAQKQVGTALLLLAGVGEDALRKGVLGANTRNLPLPLVHVSDPEFIASLLLPDPPAQNPASVLQVLLAHAAALERHTRTADATSEHHGLLLEGILSAEIDVDLTLVREAFAALDAGEEAVSDLDLVTTAAATLTDAVGRLNRATLADRAPFPVLRAPTTAAQLAGSELSLERLGGPIAAQIAGEVLGRAVWGQRFREALTTVAGIESLEERRLLFAGTLDTCSHRFDAWLTSAASRRVSDLRARGGPGAYLGAYGWLEDIELRTPQPAGQVDGRDVLDDGADGGYVHAPGLTQAATAAVLRSGRLTHRDGAAADAPLDIDLSSTRVRDALALLEAVRRGQELGALLGYRLERRLHERSQPGVVELDRFIYVLRTLAPMRAGRLTDAGQPVVEALAASDVVDGLALMAISWPTVSAALTSGPRDARYIPPGSWVPPTPTEEAAVRAAVDELERTHDAVADLLLAEAVHQIVSGNPARAAAAMDALAAGESMPPEPDVVRTPRSGLSLQHRVAILVPSPVPPAGVGWNPAAPRALAEPRLEVWAQAALGDPGLIPVLAGSAAKLSDAGLCALDVLHDADGDTVATSTLAARVRRALDAPVGADVTPLGTVWDLAGLLRAQLAAARPLDVADVGRPEVPGAVGRLVDHTEWLNRATMAVTDRPEPDRRSLKTAVAAARSVDVAGAPDPVAAAVLALDELAPFGVRPPPGVDALELDELVDAVAALVALGQQRVEAAEALLARATNPATAPRSVGELAGQALAAVFGEGFLSVPVIRSAPAGELDAWAGAVGPAGVRPRAGRDIRPWLARTGRVREAVAAYGETVLVREALGRRPVLAVAQSPAGAYQTWVGLPFPDGLPPQVPMASTVVEVVAPDGSSAAAALAGLAGDLAGLVVDEWTEVVPRRLVRGDPADPAAPSEVIDVTTTGLAVNANAPGARPPQAILVACSSDGQNWTGDKLAHLLDDTMALARMRAVTLDLIPLGARYLPALYVRDWSLQGEPSVDFRVVSELALEREPLLFLTAEN